MMSLCGACSAKPFIECSGCNASIGVVRSYGTTLLKKLKECSACQAQILEDTISKKAPCCEHTISLCDTCSKQSEIPCSGCNGSIGIDRTLYGFQLKKLKKCSACPQQIADNTVSNKAPCCEHTISLCDTCSKQSEIQCSGCNASIGIGRTPYGNAIQLKKFKKCSACPKQIVEDTVSHKAPCCDHRISLCGTCSAQPQVVPCSGCNENILINKNRYGSIELRKPKKCSVCFDQIAENTKSNNAPCCNHAISLCGTCAIKPQVPCVGCKENITTDHTRGYLEFKKLKKCSACPKKILDETTFNYAPCCFNRISLCETCAVKPQISCPSVSCYNNIVIESKDGKINLKKPVTLKKCSTGMCFNQIPEDTESNETPCCYRAISLCETCASKPQITCPDAYCNEKIMIESKDGKINLKKPVKLKKCSACPNRIPEDTESNEAPCCEHEISLCKICTVKSQIPCSGCNTSIAINHTLYGLRLEKLKKCSACPKQIADTTEINVSPCCFNSPISLCEACAVKPQIPCPSCNENIMIKSQYGTIALEKPIKLKKCSICPAQIPEDTEVNANPCCYGHISLCDTCSAQSEIPCPSRYCNKNIVIKHRNGLIKLEKLVKLKECSVCPNQIPEDTESTINPCCYGRISLCNTCSAQSEILCPHCPDSIRIKRRYGRVELEKIVPMHHKQDELVNKNNPIDLVGDNPINPGNPINLENPNPANPIDPIVGPGNPINDNPSGNLTSKITMLGSAATVLWCCTSAWKKYCVRNELDALEQHAKKLAEERSDNVASTDECLPSLPDQFDIPILMKNLSYYISETVTLENAIQDFGIIASSKNRNQQVMDASFENLSNTINEYKNHIGSPVKNLLGASIVAIGGFLLGKFTTNK